jgi:hypothetical protein
MYILRLDTRNSHAVYAKEEGDLACTHVTPRKIHVKSYNH